MKKRKLNQIDKIIIHCSDSDRPEDDNIFSIRRWHWEKGYQDIGYNFVVTKSGEICEGRRIDYWGAHCIGENRYSIGICLTGKHEFTEAQFKATKELCEDLIFKDPVSPNLNSWKRVFPHSKFNPNKTCPNFPIQKIVLA
jgi:N-acetylmuramoyl-L-alanine amidase